MCSWKFPSHRSRPEFSESRSESHPLALPLSPGILHVSREIGVFLRGTLPHTLFFNSTGLLHHPRAPTPGPGHSAFCVWPAFLLSPRPLSQSQLKGARVGGTLTTGGHLVSGSPCDLEGIYSVPRPTHFLCPFCAQAPAQALHGSGGRGSASRSPSLLAPGAIRLVCATADARAHPQHSLGSCLLPPPPIPLPGSPASRLGTAGARLARHLGGQQTGPAQRSCPRLLSPSPGVAQESECNKPLGCCCACEDPGPAGGVVGQGRLLGGRGARPLALAGQRETHVLAAGGLGARGRLFPGFWFGPCGWRPVSGSWHIANA